MSHFTTLAKSFPNDRRIGGLVGLLAGDALGVGFEFKTASQIPSRDQIEMITAPHISRTYADVQAGTWSDDGAQALALLASLIECNQLSLKDFSQKLVAWYRDGYMAIDGYVFDVGVQTANAISRIEQGIPVEASGGASEKENGNGSLMRVLPLALWHTGTDEHLALDAHRQSLPTHAHRRSQVACAYYCLIARAYLAAVPDPWAWASQRLLDIYRSWPDAQEGVALLTELTELQRFPELNRPSGSGYVLDTLWSAHIALQEASFEEVIRTAIAFGNDTDTTAAVAGGLAGIRFTLSGIPPRWLQSLRGCSLVEPLLAGLST